MEVDPFRDDNFTYKTQVKCISKFRRVVRLMDMYALPITLRYKEEKKFFTNFGAATSILLMLGMVALLVTGLRDMVENVEITQTTTFKLISGKPSELETRGGTFLFGYRILDADNNLFNDPTILTTTIKTLKQQWNDETGGYESSTTAYFEGDCYEEAQLILSQQTSMSFDVTSISRADGTSYSCPKNLLGNFVSGTKFSNLFIRTMLEVQLCDDDNNEGVICADPDTI